MPMSAEEITKRIKTALPDAQVTLTDLAGDNDHWKVEVTSHAFAGLPKVKQHQLVYKAIGEGMGTTLHALAVETKAA
jgi:stress-induced morphogen